jgi:hypothetical protein
MIFHLVFPVPLALVRASGVQFRIAGVTRVRVHNRRRTLAAKFVSILKVLQRILRIEIHSRATALISVSLTSFCFSARNSCGLCFDCLLYFMLALTRFVVIKREF